MMKAGQSASVAILGAVLLLGGCLPGRRSDPGNLEVRNYLRDPVVAVVGGTTHTVFGCSTLQLADVELRRVRIVSPAGIDLMRIDSPTGVPIGPRRYILVEGSGVHDLRTFPNGDRPGPGMECLATLQELQQPRGSLGG